MNTRADLLAPQQILDTGHHHYTALGTGYSEGEEPCSRFPEAFMILCWGKPKLSDGWCVQAVSRLCPGCVTGTKISTSRNIISCGEQLRPALEPGADQGGASVVINIM